MPKRVKAAYVGKALEYLVVNQLRSLPGCSLTPDAKKMQRAHQKYPAMVREERLGSQLLEGLEQGASVTVEWMTDELRLETGKFMLHRPADRDDGTADVVIRRGRKSQNISLKHNNHSLKHQRPYRFLNDVKLSDSTVSPSHEKKIKRLTDDFSKKHSKKTYFSRVERASKDLEVAVCDATSQTLKRLRVNPRDVEKLFRYLIGHGSTRGDYLDYLVVVKTKGGKTQEGRLAGTYLYAYEAVPMPKQMKVRTEVRGKNNYVVIDFDNGWVVSMRIHRDDNKIPKSGKHRLKFDCKLDVGRFPVSPVILYDEELHPWDIKPS